MIHAILSLLLAISAHASLSKKEQATLRVDVLRYAKAFNDGDWLELKPTVTDEFIEMMGGESALKERLATIEASQKKPARPEIHQVLEKNGQVYVHLGPRGGIESDASWFRLKHGSHHWKIEALVPDFDP